MNRIVLPRAAKRLALVLACVSVSAVITTGAYAQQTPSASERDRQRVGIIPIDHPTESVAASRIAESIAETVELLMSMTGRYDVRILTDESPRDGLNDPEAITASHNLDAVIFGSVAERPDGSIRLSLSGYDRFLESVSTEVQLEIDSYLASFDAADRIAVELIEGFSGVRLTYGSIELIGVPADANVTVAINGVPLNVTGTRIDRIVAGEHTFLVEQERIFGREVLFERRIAVDEGATTTIDVAVPFYTAEEAEYFEALNEDIHTFFRGRGPRGSVQTAVDETVTLLGNVANPGATVTIMGEVYRGIAAAIGDDAFADRGTTIDVGAEPLGSPAFGVPTLRPAVPGAAGSGSNTVETAFHRFITESYERRDDAGRPVPAGSARTVPNGGDIVAAVGATEDAPATFPPHPLGERIVEYDVAAPWQLAVDQAGHIWGSNRNGIIEYDPETETVSLRVPGPEFPLAHHDVGPVAVDGTDLWIGYAWEGDRTGSRTDGSGVTRWNRVTGEMDHFSAENTATFPPGPVWTVDRAPSGEIWVGTRFGPEAFYDGRRWHSFSVEEYDPSEAFFDVNGIRFHDGLVYFSSWRGGLHRFDPTTGEWHHTDLGKEWNGETRSFLARGVFESNIAFHTNGTLYVGTSESRHERMPAPDGIWRYDGEAWRNVTEELPMDGSSIRGLTVDNEGRLWAAFEYDNTVKIYADGVWTNWTPNGVNGWSRRTLSIIGRYGDQIWFSSAQGGRETLLAYRLQ